MLLDNLLALTQDNCDMAAEEKSFAFQNICVISAQKHNLKPFE